MNRRGKTTRRSYKAFNYNLRPSKHIERRLMMEVFQRLTAFHPLTSYQYVGMGSVYFVDFILVHRLLGIRNLISIEDEEDPLIQRRFHFNRPFREVQMMFEKSSDALPKLDWSTPSIAWMDYDGMVEPYVLTDVATVAAGADTGTVLVITLNAEAETPSDKQSERRVTEVTKLSRRLPPDKMPAGLSPSDLHGWGMATTLRRILYNQVEDTLAIRNGIIPAGQKIQFHQVFHFHYRDAARMVTVGFLFIREGDQAQFAASGIPMMEGYRDADQAIVIDVPHLTNRELRYFEKQLPPHEERALRLVGLTEQEFEAYRPFYRHYPTYAESWF